MWCPLSHHSHKYRKRIISDFRRGERRREAQRKLRSLARDQNHVLSAHHGGEGILDIEENFEFLSRELTVDDVLRLFNTRDRLENDIEQLMDALADSQDNIDALFRVIEASGLLGRFMGPHPLAAKRAANEHVPQWHKTAIARAIEIRKKRPDPKNYSNFRIATDIYQELKDMPDGPKSAAAVNKALARKLWTTGVRPTK
jgi:hypothetical protein